VRGSKREIKRGVWELRVSLGKDPVTDKYKVRSKTFHGSARAADEALRDLIDQQAPSRSDWIGATFVQLLDQWLEECERLDLSPTTLRTYRAQIKQTIRPRLGKVLPSRRPTRSMRSAAGSPSTVNRA
jgi:integrase